MNETRYQTLWPRFCAGFIDIIVVLPFLVALFAFDLSSLTWIRWILSFVMILVNTTCFVLMHARSGQTIGKKAMNVRVVDSSTEDGITLKQSLWRESPLIAINVLFVIIEFAIIVSGVESVAAPLMAAYTLIQRLPNLWVIVDAVTSLFNSKRRTLHDFIGRTVVVKLSPG